MVQPPCTSTALFLYSDFNTSYVVVQQRLDCVPASCGNISIHLMLWFNPRSKSNPSFCICISIHLMLWFNTHGYNPLKILGKISIHLMLWFNVLRNVPEILILVHFNTSYVVVQLLILGKSLSVFRDFNTSYVVVQPGNLKEIEVLRNYFNTSYVVVQRCY